MQAIVEQLRQILECQVALFIPGCADAGLRHPLLDFLPANALSELCCISVASEKKCPESLWIEEPVQALCDLALQSGRMQVLNERTLLTDHWVLESVAAVSLDCPAGTLGVFLLADERPEKFGVGEERLVYACLSMRSSHLDHALREHARLFVVDDSNKTRSYFEPGRLIKDEFVSIVGHELRAPLSIIKGYAGLLQVYGGTDSQQDAALTPARQRQYLDAIMEQTNLLEVLVNDLLDISRIQRGKLALHPRMVDVGAVCRQIIQSGQLRADQQDPGKHRLECKLPAGLSPVWMDADRLRQILTNVVENAIKFSPDGGLISLEVSLLELDERRLRTPGGQQVPTLIRFIVRDQGIGMPAQHSVRLFQPFERLEQPGAARVAGMGLGLYITRKLVEMMGGSIDLQSYEEIGTTVMITLPAVGSGEVSALEAGEQASCLSVG